MDRVSILPVALLSAAFLLAGCGGDGGDEGTQRNDRAAAQQELTALLVASPYGAKGARVRCPSTLELTEGGSFACAARATDGSAAKVRTTATAVTDQAFTLRVENLIPTERIERTCSKELLDLVTSAGIEPGAENCEVTCPSLVAARPNGDLHCAFAFDGCSGNVRISLGSDGMTTKGGWKATEQ